MLLLPRRLATAKEGFEPRITVETNQKVREEENIILCRIGRELSVDVAPDRN